MRWLVLLTIFTLLTPALTLLAASDAHASDSNYYVFFYPKADCRELSFPSGNERRDWKYFHRNLERYVDCMQKYLRNAENDIECIKEKAQEALQGYERFMNQAKRERERY